MQISLPVQMVASALSPTDSLVGGDATSADLYAFLQTDPHGRKTAWIAGQMGRAMGLEDEALRGVVAAAATHDIGKYFVPVAILNKPAALSPSELRVVQQHTWFGRDILVQELFRSDRRLDIELASQRDAAFLHHERWDGGGYPLGLRGKEIPLVARIVSVADVFDALTTARSYKTAWPVSNAMDYIITGRENQFDPLCVDALLDAAPEFLDNWSKTTEALSQAAPSPFGKAGDWLRWIECDRPLAV